MTKVYLDNCVLNRPFDDQSQERIRLETEAIILLLARLERKEWAWLSSRALEIEIEKMPDAEQQSRLRHMIEFASLKAEIGEKELERASELQKLGFVGFDAVHIACAEIGKADILLTTDDRMLKLAKRRAKKLRVKIENPLDWMKERI
jgi:predicted nucleic acid-binding protein